MKVILTDSRILGKILINGRKSAKLRRCDAMRIFGLDAKSLRHYELGYEQVPEFMLAKLISAGYVLLSARHSVKKRQ